MLIVLLQWRSVRAAGVRRIQAALRLRSQQAEFGAS